MAADTPAARTIRSIAIGTLSRTDRTTVHPTVGRTTTPRMTNRMTSVATRLRSSRRTTDSAAIFRPIEKAPPFERGFALNQKGLLCGRSFWAARAAHDRFLIARHAIGGAVAATTAQSPTRWSDIASGGHRSPLDRRCKHDRRLATSASFAEEIE